MKKFFKNMYFLIDKKKDYWYNYLVKYGGVAQLARAFGSYPTDRWFESTRRYHEKSLFCLSTKETFFNDICFAYEGTDIISCLRSKYIISHQRYIIEKRSILWYNLDERRRFYVRKQIA